MAQAVSVGIKGGLPLTPVSDIGHEVGRYGGDTNFRTNRYLVGPALEIALPFGVRFEADALYRHARQDRFSGPAPTATLNYQTTRMNIWEFPLLLKYRRDIRRFRPYVVTGSTLRRIENLDVSLLIVPTFPNYPSTQQHFTNSSGEPLRYGATFGAGVSRRVRFVSFEPEFRYTHWTAKHWMAATEEIEFLLGLRFSLPRRSRYTDLPTKPK